MSLKAVHLVFVCAFTGMALGCAVWKLRLYLSAAGTAQDLWFAIGSLAAAIGIVVYGRYFFKKLKRVSYL